MSECLVHHYDHLVQPGWWTSTTRTIFTSPEKNRTKSGNPLPRVKHTDMLIAWNDEQARTKEQFKASLYTRRANAETRLNQGNTWVTHETSVLPSGKEGGFRIVEISMQVLSATPLNEGGDK